MQDSVGDAGDEKKRVKLLSRKNEYANGKADNGFMCDAAHQWIYFYPYYIYFF